MSLGEFLARPRIAESGLARRWHVNLCRAASGLCPEAVAPRPTALASRPPDLPVSVCEGARNAFGIRSSRVPHPAG
jgi:hypothetical protein